MPVKINKQSHFHSSRRYIEIDLPIEDLSPVATREANSRKPIYQIHKWWARRLGSVFRTLLLASFADYTESSETLWSKYSFNETLKNKVILDPMMGGGTSIVEGLQLGCKVVGVDINPVAWFVTKKEVEPLNLDRVNRWFAILQNTVGNEIAELYETRCLKSHHADIMYALWYKHLICKGCSRDVILVRSYIISDRQRESIVLCPSCLSVFQTRAKQKTTCPRCHHVFNINAGTVRKGVISCPYCHGKETILDAVKRYGHPLPLKMLCIEYYCKECGRGYKEPDIFDLKKYRCAEKRFKSAKDTLPYPRERIPRSKLDPRPLSHGYRYFHELFNERQLLSLSLLLKKIMEIGDRSTKEFLLLAFSACLETNNMLCKYESKWQKASSCFGIPAFHPVERIAENNVWGTEYGRGTFTKCFKKLIKAKVVKSQYNRSRNSRVLIGLSSDESGFTELAGSFKELTSSYKKAFLACGNSESLRFIRSNSIDLVLTDPPHFDNLNYSRLADFFYVWLRKGLSHDHKEFRRHTSAHGREIVMDGTPNRNLDNLVESLAQVLSECHRVLKQDGLLVFTFHHTKSWAWKGLAQALFNAKFTVVATHYVRSEGRTGFRKNGNISYDACVVCRKSTDVRRNENIHDVKRCSENWVRRLIKAGNDLQRVDAYTIVMGESLNHSPSFLLLGSSHKFINDVTEACIELKDKLERQCLADSKSRSI